MKKKIVIIVSIIILLFIGFIWISGGFNEYLYGPAKSRDARRKSDIRQISLAMEYYRDENNQQYLQSNSYPTAIGKLLTIMPQDPGEGTCSSYNWISNINDPQKYCIWACLDDGKFIVASPKGVTTTDKAPTDLNCGEEVIEKEEVKNENIDLCNGFSGIEIYYLDCEVNNIPQVIKKETSQYSEEMENIGGYFDSHVCEINLDDNDKTKEYLLALSALAQNETLIVYQEKDGNFNEILNSGGRDFKIEYEKTNQYYNINISGHIGAQSYFVKRYKWNSSLLKYEGEGTECNFNI